MDPARFARRRLSEAGLDKTLAHALAGGTTSRWRGGGFREGFFSAGFAQFAAPFIEAAPQWYQRVALASAVGGGAATLGGGKFENGAVTAAFARLFNDEHEWLKRFRQERRQTADGYLAEQARARDVGSYNETTKSEVVTALAVTSLATGAGGLVTGGRGSDFPVNRHRNWGSGD